MRSELFFQTSPWFILVCLALGVGYAFFLYKPEQGWDKKFTWALGALRALLISLICFLLLSPFVRTITSTIDKAKIVFAIDNSLSVGSVIDKTALPVLKEAQAKLSELGYEVNFVSLSTERPETLADSVLFNQKKTDLSGLLSTISSNYEGRNLTDVLLFSDGIANQGMDPSYSSYPFRVHTLGVGDTLPKRDIEIRNVVSNRIATMGNTFPVQVDIVAHGFAGKSTTVQLKQGGKVVESQTVVIDKDDFFGTYSFKTSSAQKGVQQYSVEVNGINGEHTLVNNIRKLYVDVIDGKQKILLLTLAPHPDVKAIRAIIEKNENYELDVKILSSGAVLADLDKPYDLVILHQVPDNSGLGNEYLRKLVAKPVPLFFMIGNQSSLSAVSNLSKAVQIAGNPGQVDKVSGKLNSQFQSLNLDADKLEILTKLPPMSVPFANYRLANGSEVVIHQRVGNLVTQKPLLLVNTALERKVGILIGEGIWQWRMEEFALTEKQEIVDDLLAKVIQLLSVKEDKRKFRVYPIRAEFDEGDQVVFQTEVYNDIYEKVFGQEIKLEIEAGNGSRKLYTYQNLEEASRFEISGLSEGVYKYKASAAFKSGVEEVVGQFVVRNVNVELLSTTANFNLLRELANKNGGKFARFPDVQQLIDEISKEHRADRLDSAEEMLELINLKWLFFVLLILATIEWGVRKYNGSY